MDISESLERVYSSTELLGSKFYKQFFMDCPEAKRFFAKVNMDRQAVVVTMALTLVKQYYVSPFAPSEAYFRYLGTQHRDWGIPQEMFEPWTTSMLKTLADLHGDDWSEQLQQQWESGLKAAIAQMFVGYELPI
ncbi:globin [Pirellulales bacterium]|nr:globin [Pirellulales bacterium]